jgi:hypothetical protein
MCAVIRAFWTLDPSDIWLAIVLGHFTRAVLSVSVFKRERWRNIRVAIPSAEP